MRNSFLFGLLLAVGCSTSAPLAPTRTNQPDPLLKAQSFFDVIDRRVWLVEGDLPMRSTARTEVLRLQGANSYELTDFTKYLPEIVGPDREFTLIPLSGTKNPKALKVKVKSARFIAIEPGDLATRKTLLNDCMGYPDESVVIAFENEQKTNLNGYLFPLGTRLITQPEKEIPALYQTYRTEHTEFVTKSYGDLYPNYEKIIDLETVIARTPDSILYFFAPNPPSVDSTTYRAYRFDDNLKTFSTLTLPVRFGCAKK